MWVERRASTTRLPGTSETISATTVSTKSDWVRRSTSITALRGWRCSCSVVQRDLRAGDDDVSQEVHDEPAQPQRPDVQVHAQRRQREHQADHERDQHPAHDVDGREAAPQRHPHHGQPDHARRAAGSRKPARAVARGVGSGSSASPPGRTAEM